MHLIRSCRDYANWKERRVVAATLKPIAPTVEAALAALAEFERGPCGQRYAPIAQAWRRAWDWVIPFFIFPPAIRKLIYTTNAIESITRSCAGR